MDSNPIPPLSRQKNEMLIFGLFNFWWLARWIQTPSAPAKRMVSSESNSQKNEIFIFDYFQFLVISQAGQWTQTPSTTLLQPKKWNAHFWITFNFLWLGQAGQWTQTPSATSLQPRKMKCSFLDYIQLLMISCWSMDSNPIWSPTKKMKCLFLYYVILLMISWAGWWTWTPSATPLQPKKWNAYFWITFNFWWSARLVDGLKPHPPPLSSQRMKCSFLDYIQLLMIGRAGQWTRTPSASPLQPRKWNAHFWITFNFWWSARLVKGLEPYLQPEPKK